MARFCKCGCGFPCKGNYILGHHWKAKRDKLEPPNPSGLCMCGCGGVTPVADRTSKKLGHLKDEHVMHIYGHHCGPPMEPPNPSGLCMCGCGGKTPLARQSNRAKGTVKGYPTQFIHNHHMREPGPEYVIEDRGYKTPCWIWQLHKDEHGYGAKSTFYDGSYRTMGAHRAYYMRFKGNIPNGYHVDHLCFVPACVNPDHLEAVTPLENSRRRRYVVLSEDKIPTIKQLRKWGASYSVIAPLFGVSAQTIFKVCAGQNWR